MILQNDYTKKRLSGLYISLLIGILTLIPMSIFIFSEMERIRNEEEITVSKSYSAFQSESGRLIFDSINLLRGYLALIETTDVKEEETAKYLKRLTVNRMKYVRNISVIDNTTIKWVFPLQGNESTIGTNLVTIEEQKDAVIKTKVNRLSFMDGPVNLLQGGRGFIARVPIVSQEGSYMGQLAIVLDADEILNKFEEISNEKGIRLHIVSLDNGKVVMNNEEILDKDPIQFTMNEEYFNWKVYVIPENGWNRYVTRFVLCFVLAALLAFIVGYAVYYLLRTNTELKKMASRDSLTGLYNRHFLEDFQAFILSKADRYQRNVGFILLDLDDFKKINDTYGHKIGDKVLQTVASILSENIRTGEVSFRLGGDEFLVVIPELNGYEDIEQVISRIESKFLTIFDILGNPIQIEPSIGYAIYPLDGIDFDQVLHKADLEMYKMKETRRERKDEDV